MPVFEANSSFAAHSGKARNVHAKVRIKNAAAYGAVKLAAISV